MGYRARAKFRYGGVNVGSLAPGTGSACRTCTCSTSTSASGSGPRTGTVAQAHRSGCRILRLQDPGIWPDR